MEDYIAKLMQAQGRAIDEVVLAKMRSGRSLYEKVALRVEMRHGSGLGTEWRTWSRNKVTSEVSVRVIRQDLSWVEFQRRARALREAGML